MEQIRLNEQIIKPIFSDLSEDIQKELKKMSNKDVCYVVPRTGEVITNGISTGIFTGYFSDALFKDHSLLNYDRGDWYVDGFWCDGKEEQKILTGCVGSDGWDLLINENTKQRIKAWQFCILFENEELELYDIWFKDQDKAYILGF